MPFCKIFFLADIVSLDGNKVIDQEGDEGLVFKIKNRAIRERGNRALLSYPGICKRADSVLKFREPNHTNLTRNGVHKLDLSSITLEEVVLFVNTYLYLVNLVFRGFPLFFRPGWACVFRGDQCGDAGVLDDRGAFLLQLMLNRIDPVVPLVTSHRDCGAPNCCSYPRVKGSAGDYDVIEDARKRFGPALCEQMTGRCPCCPNSDHGNELPTCRCCEFCDRNLKEQFSHLGNAVPVEEDFEIEGSEPENDVIVGDILPDFDVDAGFVEDFLDENNNM